MTTKKLQQTQLFSMGRPGLQRRFWDHFEMYHSIQHIVESSIVMLLRNAFSPFDFSYMAQDLICHIFLESDVKELAPVRHFCVYFEEFFTPEDWKKVLDRLFENHEEYLAVTKFTRDKTDHLHKMLHSGNREAKELMNIATVYRDANGKKHRFTLKDVDPCYSIEETTDLLSILNTLTLFEKDGVRRFTELVRYTYLPTEPVYDSERESEPTVDLVKVLQPRVTEALSILTKLEVVEEDSSEDPVLFVDSSDYLKNNTYAGKTPEETTDFLLDGFTLPLETDDTEMINRILTAFVRGIQLKDAKPEFLLDDIPNGDPENEPSNSNARNSPLEKLSKNDKGKQPSKNRKKKQSTYEGPEKIRQRKEQHEKKQLKRRLDKKLGKKKKKRK
ncbi:hypothetical protein [Enterococcus sp. AZ072]|uniref:hypothetical protein n=1 Tax=unclassified Enterococcus TaxID=2608891 RepID=UPI003D2A8B07